MTLTKVRILAALLILTLLIAGIFLQKPAPTETAVDNVPHETTEAAAVEAAVIPTAPPFPEDVPEEVPKEAAAEEVTASEGFLLPLDGEIIRGHGFSYDGNHEDYRFHHGADIRGTAGDAVVAARSGTVTHAHEDAYWGGTVTVLHDDGTSFIYRAAEPAVTEGTHVEQGDVVAFLLSSAPGESVLGAHLHLEFLSLGESLDPFTAATGQ